MRRYVLITTSVILILGVSLFFGLGGGDELVFEIIEQPAGIVRGKLFEGRPTEQKLEARFIDTRERSKDTGFKLIVINYEKTEKSNIKQFVGTLGDPMESTALDKVSIPEGYFVKTKISAHNLVMPRPEEIKEAAIEFATAQGVELISDTSYEIYEGDSVLVVMFQSK